MVCLFVIKLSFYFEFPECPTVAVTWYNGTKIYAVLD